MPASSSLPQIVTAPISAVVNANARPHFSPSAKLPKIPQPHPLRAHFDALFAAHGPQYWWSARTRFEIIVGAILTQNTSWKNVKRAIANLRRDQLLSPAAIHNVSLAALEKALRPSGYYRQKTKT